MDRKREILEVKALGDRIGYGNMMDIASALWTLELERLYGIKNGAFIPTVESLLTKRGKEIGKKSIEFRLYELKRLGF